MAFPVTRAHLKRAVEQADWDLLDRLLELDPQLVNENNLFTDTWGTWYGALYECTIRQKLDGVRVLLKHGADPDLKCWGDCVPESPLEVAREGGFTELVDLLNGSVPAEYTRRTEPELPQEESARDRVINRQGEIARATGLMFQEEAFPPES